MKIGSENGNKKTPIAGAVSSLWTSSVFCHYYCILLGNSIGLAVLVTCLYCALWLHIQCDWVVLMWQAMLQCSLVHVWEGLGTRLGEKHMWTIYENNFTRSWNKTSIPTVAAWFLQTYTIPHFQFCSLAVRESSYLALFYTMIACFPSIASPSICQYRNTGGSKGLRIMLS